MRIQFTKSIKRTPLLLWCLSAFIQGQSAFDAIHLIDRELGLGSRALAMGGAYTGLANDYTAIYWNPAGLGTLENEELFVEISHLNFSNNAFFMNKWNSFDQTYTRIRSFGLAYPFPTKQGSFVVAMGYNRILDFEENLFFSGMSQEPNGIGFSIADESEETTYYPFDQDVERLVQLSSDGGLHQWSLGGAVALSPRFLFGITASFTGGNEQYKYLFIQTDSNNNYHQYPADFHEYKLNQILQSDYNALNIKIGGLIQLNHGLTIGGTITLPSRFLVEEVHTENDELTFDDGFISTTDNNGQWQYEVTKPFNFDGGLSYSSKFITLAASARYLDFSQTRFNVQSHDLADSDYREFLDENDLIRRNYTSTIEYHLGSEINVPIFNTKLRGGYAAYPSPLKNANRNQDHLYLTGGVSFSIDEYVRLDFTYLHGSWEQETQDANTPSGTIENITDKKTLVSISYDF